MSPRALACPNCGAPFAKQTGDLWSCLHCGAISRVREDSIEVETKIPEEAYASLKQLVIAGKRDEAKRFAVQQGLPESAVEEMFEKVANASIWDRTLNGIGWLMMFGFAMLVVLGIVAVRSEITAGWILVVFGAFNLLVFLRAMIRTLQMVGKPSGIGTVRRATLLGTTGTIGKNAVHIFAFDVDVEPSSGDMGFRTSILVPVRDISKHKAVEGQRLKVRMAEDRSWVRYAGLVDP